MSEWLARNRFARHDDTATNAYRGRDFTSIAASNHALHVRSARRAVSEAQRVARVMARFDAPPQRVFSAWLEQDVARQWLFAMATRPIDDAAIDARVGGAFRFARGDADEHAGRYLEIEPHRRLAFTLVTSLLPSTDTYVRVDIAKSRERSVVRLSHAGVPVGFVHVIRERWLGMLYGLAVTLDSL
jgi:uncharacterized protein YndB with AHSA1/START domain